MSDPKHKNATNGLQFSWGCRTVSGWAICILFLASLLACTTKSQTPSQKPKYWRLPQVGPLKVQPFVQGRIITVNPSASAAVGWFTPGFLPAPGLEFYAIRDGIPVAKLVALPGRTEDSVLMEIIEGECKPGDELTPVPPKPNEP
jgi:hypothetical protein